MASDGTYSRISYETGSHVTKIGLRRPEKRNAFDLAMLRELADAYTRFEEDDDARCALLFAHGDHFTGGLDLGEVGPAVRTDGKLWPADKVDPLGLEQRRRTKPVVAACQGWCLTIGTELALACDIVVAAEDARFGQIEVKRGIYPFGGATLRLPRVAGWHNAMRYLLTGDIFDAAEAHRIGVVQQVVAPEALHERASALAISVAAQAPLAVQACIVSARCGFEDPQAEAKKLIERAQVLMATEDADEGLQSFLERRDAVFTGR